jgi:hypothetical protein
MSDIKKLQNQIEKQELLIKLYEELLDNNPVTIKETKILKTKISVAKEEILKNNFDIKKTIDLIRKEEAQ